LAWLVLEFGKNLKVFWHCGIAWAISVCLRLPILAPLIRHPSGTLRKRHRALVQPSVAYSMAAELGPAREKGEVLAAFAAHKKAVTAGYKTK
jgi:hypothetical protein